MLSALDKAVFWLPVAEVLKFVYVAGNASNNNGYVTFLKNKVNKLVSEVRVLKSRVAHEGGRRSNLRDLRLTYKWTEDDIDISEQVLKYLFPRFKFPDKGWMEHDPSKNKSFSSFVKRHLQLRPGKQFADKWDTIIAPAIVKKYTDMRCNVNNDVRRTFMGECSH